MLRQSTIVFKKCFGGVEIDNRCYTLEWKTVTREDRTFDVAEMAIDLKDKFVFSDQDLVNQISGLLQVSENLININGSGSTPVKYVIEVETTQQTSALRKNAVFQPAHLSYEFQRDQINTIFTHLVEHVLFFIRQTEKNYEFKKPAEKDDSSALQNLSQLYPADSKRSPEQITIAKALLEDLVSTSKQAFQQIKTEEVGRRLKQAKTYVPLMVLLSNLKDHVEKARRVLNQYHNKKDTKEFEALLDLLVGYCDDKLVNLSKLKDRPAMR